MKDIEIIKRCTIPVLTDVEIEGEKHFLGVVRDFTRNQNLKDFIADVVKFSMGWVNLDQGETLKTHMHPTRSMVILCKGSGTLIGNHESDLEEGDIILIPTGCLHGFKGGSPNGFWGLSLQFEQRGFYEMPEKPLTRFLR